MKTGQAECLWDYSLELCQMSHKSLVRLTRQIIPGECRWAFRVCQFGFTPQRCSLRRAQWRERVERFAHQDLSPGPDNIRQNAGGTTSLFTIRARKGRCLTNSCLPDPKRKENPGECRRNYMAQQGQAERVQLPSVPAPRRQTYLPIQMRGGPPNCFFTFCRRGLRLR